MKKYEDLKRDGWEIDEKDNELVLRDQYRKNINQAIKDVTDSIKASAGVNKKLQNGMAALLKSQEKLAKALTPPNSCVPKKWEFKIKRNSKGFISKIYAKET